MRPSAAPTRLRQAIPKIIPLLLVLAALAGCGIIPPEPETEAAQDVWNLYLIVFIMGAAVFVGVEGFIVYAIFRYRRRDDRLPEQLHGNTMIEIVWTAIPTVIVLVLFVLSIMTLTTVEARSPNPGVNIEVTGYQWQWQFRYLDGDGDAENDVNVIGTSTDPAVMVVPVGEPVHLTLLSSDVIHAFYVPQFLIKRDVVPLADPNDANEMEFTVTEPGTYAGQCAEFCGLLHARMTFSVQALSRADYDQWLADAKAGRTPPPQSSGQAGGPTLELESDNIEFSTRELTAPADQGFTIHFTNREGVVHNVSIFDANNEKVFTGDPITGPDAEISYQVPPLPAGEYTFICDYHPVADMTGTLTIE
jgi:cytochrome c oxidase subunit 2